MNTFRSFMFVMSVVNGLGIAFALTMGSIGGAFCHLVALLISMGALAVAK